MDIKINELKTEMMKEFIITADQKEWAEAQNGIRKEIAKTIQIKGFRKGQAPDELVNARIQDSIVIDDALKMYGPTLVQKAVEGQDDIIKSQPKIDVLTKDVNKLEIKFTFFKKPEIKQPNWKEVTAETGATTAKQEEVDLELKALQNRFAKPSKKDGAADKGDVVILDFTGYLNGEAFDGGTAKNHALELGSNSFIPGFEDQLVGIKAGESKDVVVTFPKDYPSAKLAGKEVTFKCDAKEVNVKELPEINDEFVKGLNTGFLNTKEDLIKNIKSHIKQAKEMQIRRKNEEKIVQLIADTADVKMPKIWIDQEAQRLRAQFEQKLAMQGMTISDYSEKTKNDEKKILEELIKDAENRLTTQFVLADVRESAKIIVSMDEAKDELTKASEAMNKPFEEVEKQVGGLAKFRANLETKKVFDHITTLLGK